MAGCAGEFQPVQGDAYEISGLAGLKRTQIVAAQHSGSTQRGHLQCLLHGQGGCPLGDSLEEQSLTRLGQHMRRIVRSAAVYAETHLHTGIQHFADGRNARSQAHVGAGTVGDAGACLGHQLNLVLIQVDSVRVPHIRPHPVKPSHVLHRPAAEPLEAELLFVQRLGHVGVHRQPMPASPGGRPLHRVAGHGEGGAGCHHQTKHGVGLGVVESGEEPLAIGEDGVFCLHHAVRGQATPGLSQ